jgi:hypothetical protein
MEPYTVFIHVDLLETVPSRGDQRRIVMRFIRSLAERPFTPGDFTDRDESLRSREVKIVGQYAITYWVDSPVKAVMVVDIRRADR